MHFDLGSLRGILAGSSVALVACLIGWWPDVHGWLLANEKLAGWAQAVGGIASIWAAFRIAMLGADLDRRRQQLADDQAKLDQHSAVLVASLLAYDRIAKTGKALDRVKEQTDSSLRLLKRTVEADVRVIERLSLDRVTDIMIIHDVAMIESSLRYAMDALDAVIVAGREKISGVSNEDFRAMQLAGAKTSLEHIRRTCLTLLTDLHTEVDAQVGGDNSERLRGWLGGTHALDPSGIWYPTALD